jgi:RNA polymerase sigma-70 factor (ECF subfamily)
MSVRFLGNDSTGNLSDLELIDRFAASGEQLFFEEIYKRYRHLAFGVCLKMMKNEDDARDVTSEVFRILFLKLPNSNVLSLKSYIYAISRNECIAVLRQRKKEVTKLSEVQYIDNASSDFMDNQAIDALLNGGPSIESVVENAVKDLGKEQRTCIHLFFYEDKSYKEIALETGYSEKQVKSYLQNGKRNLRNFLDGEMKKFIA